jgi:hypothetical protein
MSVSSLSGHPRCAFTFISTVAAFACTRCCSLMTMAVRISVSAVFTRLSLVPPPIHMFMDCRVASLSVGYNKFSLSGWDSKHSQRATSSGRLELRSSCFRHTLCDCLVLWSCRQVGVSGSPASHFSDLKLQKPAPIESDATSHDPSPAVHAPSKWKAPSRPDSVPRQYVSSGPARSMVQSSFPLV